MLSSSSTPITDLIGLLNKYKKEIQQLYDHKLAVHADAVVALLDNDENKLNQLIAKNILTRTDNLVYLNHTLTGFFDELLGTNQLIQNYKIAEKIDEIDFYMKSFVNEDNPYRRNRHSEQAKGHLIGLGKVIRRNVIDLGKQVQNDYRTETNFKNKALKIEEHNKKAEKLSELIEHTYKLLQNDLFFREAEDDVLRALRVELRNDLRVAKDDLIERHQEILRFLNKVEFQSRVFQKIQVLKQLKDSFELNNDQLTTIKPVLEEHNALFFQPEMRIQSNLPLDWLQTSEGYDMVVRIAKRLKRRAAQQPQTADKISLKTLDGAAIVERRINYQALKNKFLQSDLDLFQFVWNYPYKEEMPPEDRIRHFCKLALLYEGELFFTGKIALHGKFRYAIVYPKDKVMAPAKQEAEATISISSVE